MSVRLISITNGFCEELKDKSPEDIIVYVARVSNPQNQTQFNTSKKLLNYCIKNNHWSIFETVTFTLEIKTSRAIASQIIRHRSFTFQEFSQRYAKVQNNIIYDARTQDTKNRQNSIDNLNDKDKKWFQDIQKQVWDNSYTLYQEALEKGIAKESARFLLPLNTETTLYMTGNVRSWMTYIKLRCANGTQKEHQAIALQCQKIFTELFPNISESFFELK
jgi:thymidylate synthase (FAD)